MGYNFEDSYFYPGFLFSLFDKGYFDFDYFFFDNIRFIQPGNRFFGKKKNTAASGCGTDLFYHLWTFGAFNISHRPDFYS